MANTLLDAQTDISNDTLREIVSASAFIGEQPVAATSPFLGSNYGYTSGGSIGGGAQNVIEKSSFTSDANATDVGNLTVGRYNSSGQSSATHGYTSGGAGLSDVIDKFTFPSDANATDVGDLTSARQRTTGQSSTTHGYASGGGPSSNIIEKFPFSTDGNATDVGDLTQSKYYIAGQQY